MKRLKQWAVGSLAAVAALTAPATHAAAAGKLVVTTNTDFATAYIFRGLRYSRQAWQPGLTISHGGWSAGLWANVPFDRADTHELGPWLYYSFNAGGLAWEAGLQGYAYPENHDPAVSDSCELALTARAPLGLLTGVPVTAGLEVYYDFRYATLSLEATAEHSVEFKLGVRPAEFAAGVFLGQVDARDLTPGVPGPRWRDAYTYGGARLSLSVKLSDRAALKLTGQWDAARNADPNQGHTGNVSAALSCTWVW